MSDITLHPQPRPLPSIRICGSHRINQASVDAKPCRPKHEVDQTRPNHQRPHSVQALLPATGNTQERDGGWAASLGTDGTGSSPADLQPVFLPPGAGLTRGIRDDFGRGDLETAAGEERIDLTTGRTPSVLFCSMAISSVESGLKMDGVILTTSHNITTPLQFHSLTTWCRHC
jgi:hypothetical protein